MVSGEWFRGALRANCLCLRRAKSGRLQVKESRYARFCVSTPLYHSTTHHSTKKVHRLHRLIQILKKPTNDTNLRELVSFFCPQIPQITLIFFIICVNPWTRFMAGQIFNTFANAFEIFFIVASLTRPIFFIKRSSDNDRT
jgi:hypothetical protein